MTWTSIEERTLFYDQVAGDKPTMVFIHGWANNHTVWDTVIDRLPYHTVVYDLQGHGRSSQDVDTFSFESLVEDLMTIIETAPHREICLVGHSLGGMIALHALHHLVPDHLVLIDSSATNIHSSSRWLDEPIQRFTQWENDHEFKDLSTCDDNVDAFLRGLQDTNPEIAKKCMSLMRRNKNGIPQAPPDIRPLLIRGAKDSVLRVTHHDSLTAYFTDYEESFLPTDHNPHVERPVRTAAIIENYVES